MGRGVHKARFGVHTHPSSTCTHSSLQQRQTSVRAGARNHSWSRMPGPCAPRSGTHVLGRGDRLARPTPRLHLRRPHPSRPHLAIHQCWRQSAPSRQQHVGGGGGGVGGGEMTLQACVHVCGESVVEGSVGAEFAGEGEGQVGRLHSCCQPHTG